MKDYCNWSEFHERLTGMPKNLCVQVHTHTEKKRKEVEKRKFLKGHRYFLEKVLIPININEFHKKTLILEKSNKHV